MLSAEFNKRLREASTTSARLAELEARLQQKADEVASLNATLRAQSDKIFAQQKALTRSQVGWRPMLRLDE